ncbi:serine/threonine protein kinase [Streptomyces sp. G35A]
MRKFVKSVAVALAAFGLAFTFSSSAHAASDPVSVCGSGYYVQSSKELGWVINSGDPQAVVYLLYNASTGYNCVVTVVTGEKVSNPVGAGLRVEGGSWVKDTGNYNSYAGPVRVRATGKCVQYWGMTRWWTGSGAPQTSEYTSSLGWCG